MAIGISSMLARRFAWTVTVGGNIKVGVNLRAVTLTAATYAILAGPSSGTGMDFLVHLKARIDAALAADAITVTPTVNASGRVVLTFSNTVDEIAFSASVDALLGGLNAVATQAVWTAARQPQEVFYSGSRAAAPWRMQSVIAASETVAGVAYGITSGILRDEKDGTFSWIPRDPTVRADRGEVTTALHPLDTLLATRGSHAGEWSLDDVLVKAPGSTFALYEGNFQAARSSTSERYSLVALAAEDVRAPQMDLQANGWEAYHRWSVRMLRSGTGTRA